MQTRCGFIAVVGKPNVGKSTLVNMLIGEKISITADKPQTTRHRIIGIKTVEQVQALYIDTPGMHLNNKKAINRNLNKTAKSSLVDVDVVVFVIDSFKWDDEDE